MFTSLPTSHLHLVTSDLYHGDAIGNFVLTVHDKFLGQGLNVQLYAERHDTRISDIQPYAAFFANVKRGDTLFYQLSNHDPAWPRLMAVSCRKVVYYHNITPGHFFAPYSQETATQLDAGRAALALIASAHAVLANSQYSLAEVQPFLAPATLQGVIPPFLPVFIEDLSKLGPSRNVKPYLLTLGRVVPHKHLEAALKIFRYVHEHLPSLRLVVAGSLYEPYAEVLRKRISEDPQLSDAVQLTGALPIEEIRALFASGTGLLHTSAHEGFCMPVLEAMLAGLPVFAHAQKAVCETLGGTGILFDADKPEQAAKHIVRILNDPPARQALIATQQARGREVVNQANSDTLSRFLVMSHNRLPAMSTPHSFFNNLLQTPSVTPLAASLLGVDPISGSGPLFCSADELLTLSEAELAGKIVAVYSAQPKQAYACRMVAYDRADICLTLFPQTANRLRLMHPQIVCAPNGHEAMRLALTSLKTTFSNSVAETVTSPLECPMTILLLTHNFKVGGLENVVMDIACLAQKQGHKAIIAYAEQIDEITRVDVERAGIAHVRLPDTPEGRKRFLVEQDVSIVNAHYATILAEESRDLNIPYLQTIHNMYLWLDETSITQWQDLDKLTTGYIAVSANAAMVADLRLGLPPEKMIIVPNGSSMALRASVEAIPEHDDALRTELGIPQDGIVFVQVASFYPAKALWISVEAFAEALHSRRDIYLILLGKHVDQSYTARIYEKIAKYGITKHVILPGYREDVHRFLNLARAKIAPSFLEGWSLALSEALQLGVPIIATDVGGTCEQMRGTDNIVLPSFVEDVSSIRAEDFFSYLTDEAFHKKFYTPLAQAILKMASRPKRQKVTEINYRCRLPEETYAVHLDIMQHLVQKKSARLCRAMAYISQRQAVGHQVQMPHLNNSDHTP